MTDRPAVTDATAARVRAAAAVWVWAPPGTWEARTPEYHLLAYPTSLVVPTQVAWCRSTRPAPVVVDEVVAVAHAWRQPEVSFWVGEDTRPADLGDHLLGRGAVHVESVEVLALGLTDATLREAGLVPEVLEDGVRCAGVEVRPVLDAATLRDAELVGTEVWGDRPRTAEETDRLLAELTDPGATEQRVVAYVDGEPACAAGTTLATDGEGTVARLWGAATRPALRGRGAYRATVGTRLWLAQRRGADLGLVKAVTTTSAPVARRLGFTAHGVLDRLRLDLAAPAQRDV